MDRIASVIAHRQIKHCRNRRLRGVRNWKNNLERNEAIAGTRPHCRVSKPTSAASVKRQPLCPPIELEPSRSIEIVMARIQWCSSRVALRPQEKSNAQIGVCARRSRRGPCYADFTGERANLARNANHQGGDSKLHPHPTSRLSGMGTLLSSRLRHCVRPLAMLVSPLLLRTASEARGWRRDSLPRNISRA
jgi:hypothetical protein